MMRRTLVFVFLICFVIPVFAFNERSRSFDELVQLADTILVGTVGHVESRYGEGPLAGQIFTYYTLNQLDVLKGAVEGDDYVLRMTGGRVGPFAQVIQGAPKLSLGKTYTLFIRNNGAELFPLVGVHQGIFNVEWNAQAQRYSVRPVRASGGVQNKSANSDVSDLEDLKTKIRQRLGSLP